MSAETSTAIARLCITYCTAVPLQRYCAIGGVALAALGVPAAAVSPLAAVVGVTAGSVLFAAALLPVGWVFRELSARPGQRLVPFFRVRMLAALLVVAAIPSIVGALTASLAPSDPPLLPALVYPALWISGMIWVLFFAPASLPAPLLFLAALHLLRRGDPEAVEALLAGPVAVLCGAVLLAAWCAFSMWYLRTVRIGPFPSPLSARADDPRRYERMLPAVVTSATALALHLWQGFRPRSGFVPATIAAGIVAGAAAGFAVAFLGDSPPLAILGPPLPAAMMLMFRPAKEATFRSRLLWLKTPLSRRQLFRAAEDGLFRLYAPIGLAIVAVLGTAMAVHGTPATTVLPVVLLAASTAVLGGYLGLMSLRAAGLPEIVLRAAYVASVAFGAWLIAAERTDDSRLLWIIGAQAAAAIVCRLIAMRRWAGIDWLETRPPARDRALDMLTAVFPER